MEITLITGNKNRHKYFANLLTRVCDKLNIIEEISTLSQKKIKDKIYSSGSAGKYLLNLNKLDKKLFGNKKKKPGHRPKKYSVSTKKLNYSKLQFLENLKDSDLFILYGCSFIKKKLYNFLKEKRVICVHMGISPFYKGSDCNFWALYDNNPHLVGATILNFSKKFEDGGVIYHAIPCIKKKPQEYSIFSTMAAFESVIERIKDKSLFKIRPKKQDKKRVIRNTDKSEFNEKVIKEYFSMDINIKRTKPDLSKLKNPFFLV